MASLLLRSTLVAAAGSGPPAETGPAAMTGSAGIETRTESPPAGRIDAVERSWVVIVPVKRLELAKSRLSGQLGGQRRALALAMALDTITVAFSCPGVRVVVVTDEDMVAAPLRAGIQVVTDEPRAGINAALVHGAEGARVRRGEGLAALAADLPALRTAELRLALSLAAAHPQAFVPDAAGTGTTLYTSWAMDGFAPTFGPGSAAAHAAHAQKLDASGLRGLRRDVDTIEDLRSAVDLGLNERTAQVVAQLGGVSLPAIRPAS